MIGLNIQLQLHKMNYFKNKIKFTDNAGFTIIELIVVMAIFLFVIGAALGIFLSIIQNQRRVLSEQQFLNQISYNEEYMSKALRMAKTSETAEDAGCIPAGFIYQLTRPYGTGTSCNSSDPQCGLFTGIKFINQTGDASGKQICQEFYLDKTDPNNPVLEEIKGQASAVPLTSSGTNGLKINFIRFAINGLNLDGSVGVCSDPTACGATGSDGVQPRATILMNVKIPGDSQAVNRTIQTTVSQRNLNINK